MGNAVLLIAGEAAIVAVVVLVIYWFFFRRSRSRPEGPAFRREIIPSGATDPQEEWPSLAQKIAAAWLVVDEGANKGVHHAVGKGATLIGRGGSCDIILIGQGISRKHAQILRQGDQFFIYDLDSTNGTFVDGKMTDPSQPTPLKDGSVVSIGEMSLVFRQR